MNVQIWDIDCTIYKAVCKVQTEENESKAKTMKKLNNSNRTRRTEYGMGRGRLLVILLVRLMGNIGALGTWSVNGTPSGRIAALLIGRDGPMGAELHESHCQTSAFFNTDTRSERLLYLQYATRSGRCSSLFRIILDLQFAAVLHDGNRWSIIFCIAA